MQFFIRDQLNLNCLQNVRNSRSIFSWCFIVSYWKTGEERVQKERWRHSERERGERERERERDGERELSRVKMFSHEHFYLCMNLECRVWMKEGILRKMI